MLAQWTLQRHTIHRLSISSFDSGLGRRAHKKIPDPFMSLSGVPAKHACLNTSFLEFPSTSSTRGAEEPPSAPLSLFELGTSKPLAPKLLPVATSSISPRWSLLMIACDVDASARLWFLKSWDIPAGFGRQNFQITRVLSAVIYINYTNTKFQYFVTRLSRYRYLDCTRQFFR